MEPPRMISLKRHLDRWDNNEARAAAVFAAYLQLLAALKAGATSMAGGEGLQCREELAAVLEYLTLGASRETIEKSIQDAERAIQFLVEAINQRESGYKQIIRVMAHAGATFAQTGVEHGDELRKIAAKVEAVAQLDSIPEMRRQLGEHVEELRVTAARAQRDGEAKAKLLQQELQTARESLKSSEMLAETDPLTGLGNRRRAESAIEEAIAAGAPVSVLSLDLNGFKAVNDTYGHVQGDSLLKLIGRYTQRCLRESDQVCRWGGDEFLVVLHETALVEAQAAAERIRSEVFGEFVLGRAGEHTRVTVGASIGVAEHQPGESVQALLDRADLLMYQGKPSRRQASTVTGGAASVPARRRA
ncbi:MAG: GGDEF domain-containing protein [Terriglobales bacterium]